LTRSLVAPIREAFSRRSRTAARNACGSGSVDLPQLVLEVAGDHAGPQSRGGRLRLDG